MTFIIKSFIIKMVGTLIIFRVEFCTYCGYLLATFEVQYRFHFTTLRRLVIELFKFKNQLK